MYPTMICFEDLGKKILVFYFIFLHVTAKCINDWPERKFWKGIPPSYHVGHFAAFDSISLFEIGYEYVGFMEKFVNLLQYHCPLITPGGLYHEH